MASKSFGCVQETKQKVAPKWPGNNQLWTPSIVFQKNIKPVDQNFLQSFYTI